MSVPGRKRQGGARKPYLVCCCVLFCLVGAAGFHATSFASSRLRGPSSCWHREPRRAATTTNTLKAVLDSGGGGGGSDLEGDQDGTDMMSQLMGEVNQRESLRRKEGVRLLKRPSALLPPHAVLEHVLGSLRTPDFPTDGVGLHQAFIFSALDEEVSRGPVDYRRDWLDEDEGQPRYLDEESCAAVIRNNLGFLLGMSDFSVTGAPIFSEDDHRVTFPVRIVPDELTSSLRWVAVDFRLGRVREGSHKDCWLVERAIIRAWGGTPDVQMY